MYTRLLGEEGEILFLFPTKFEGWNPYTKENNADPNANDTRSQGRGYAFLGFYPLKFVNYILFQFQQVSLALINALNTTP